MDDSHAVDEVWWERVHAGVAVGVLGPLRLQVDGVERPLTARRQRAVLACLVHHVGEAVSADRLLHDVWGDGIPGSGVKAVAYQISRLRGLFEPHQAVIATTTAGYRLDLARERIDAHVFDELIDRARDALATDPLASEALAEQALRLRRGRPFADLDDLFVEIEAQRLEARHLLARRTLAEARLAQGRAADVVGDLGSLMAEHPLEEAVATALMTALERSGRTADALRVFDDFRRHLGSELGIEPSAQLRRLEQRLLVGDSGEHVPRTAGNLPSPLSSFVGREAEIGEIVGLLSTARLVTLTSFGGAGKTRLAIEVAARLQDRFADGVWFVDLVPISDPVLLAETIIANVGIPETGVHDTESHLRAELSGRHALIVVDNCEHIAGEVGGLVGRLLRDAPNVRVMATSRVSLGVPGEVVWNVPPLPAPTAGFDLFVQRADHVRSASVSAADHATVIRICERLDGIPLAIELASARLRVMTVEQVADHLADRFGLLVSTDRQADDRQQSLLATLSWSFDLLTAPERDLMSRVSSCVDGFALEAAVALSNGEPLAVVDRLDRLVAAGLITFADRGGAGRYRILETVRDFAVSKLGPSERVDAGHQHARYYASVAATIAGLEASGARGSIQLGDRELGNLRAAMGWAFAHGHARLGMAMANHLWRYFYEQATGSNENVRWGRLALEAIDDDDDDVMLLAAGALIEAYNLGDVSAMEAVAQRVRRGLGSVRPEVKSRLLTALAASVQETDPRAAAAYNEEAWLAVPPGPRSTGILGNQVELSWLTGTLDGPSTLGRLHEALAVMSDRPTVALKVEAGVAACAERWDEVLRITEQPVADKVRNDLDVLRIEALVALGRFAEALTLAGEPHLDDYWADAQRIRLIGAAIELGRDDPPAALECLRPVVGATRLDQRRLAMAMHVAALLGATAHGCGHDEQGAMLFGFATAEGQRLRIVLRPTQRALVADAEAACRAVLGSRRFDELAASGAVTPWPMLVDDVASVLGLSEPADGRASAT